MWTKHYVLVTAMAYIDEKMRLRSDNFALKLMIQPHLRKTKCGQKSERLHGLLETSVSII